MSLRQVDFEIMSGPADPSMRFILNVIGQGEPTKKIEDGVYQIGHFNGDHALGDVLLSRAYDHEPLIGNDQWQRSQYGVADDVEQIKAYYAPEIASEDRHYVITVKRVNRADEPAEGGWRWHKWGPYIGTREPRCEYIHDEPEIESVLIFSLHEVKAP